MRPTRRRAGGSAAAEIHALRQVFGERADQIVIANTKGLTGHPMGVGIEDVVAVKALETGIVPPVPNFREVDPELGELNLSRGGVYPVRYALRLAAGFGSQISMALLRWTPVADGRRRSPDELGFAYRIADRDAWTAWMRRMSGQPDPRLEVVTRTLRVIDPRTRGEGACYRRRGPCRRSAGPDHASAANSGGGPCRASASSDSASSDSASSGARRPGPEPATQAATPAAPERAAVPAPARGPAQSESAAPPPPSSEDAITERVLEVVARETGYPTDLLDPDLDLEADLGIDTVKQAEVFAAIREAYGIERDDALKLRDYPTLRHVVRFVIERSPQLVPSAAEEEPAPAPELAITERVLEVVARETGYPTDLLDPDLDLEADLGIDTVKQAEVFAAIREAYGIERDDALKLRDYPTLRHVVRFVIERSPQLVASAAEGEPAPAPELAIADRRGPAVAEQPEPEPAIAEQPEPEPALADQPEPEPEDGGRYPRRVPVPVLRPPLDCCVPTGVELAAGQRVVLMPDQGGIATALAGRLRKRGVEVLTIDGAAETRRARNAARRVGRAGADRRRLLARRARSRGSNRRARAACLACRSAPPRQAAGDRDASARRRGGPFLIAATRMGGRHGYDERGATSVMGGAVSGFCKALAREREGALVKVVDFEPGRKTAALAELLIDETVRDPGAVEVGHADGLRWTVGLLECSATPEPSRPLGADSTFVVTGAAGSIVSAITADLAAHAGGATFHLLDLAPGPDPTDPDLGAPGL